MEWYTGLRWAKREYSSLQILSLVCQNVCKKILQTGHKIQAKIPSHSGDCVLGEGQERPPSNGEEFKHIQHSMSTVLEPGFHI